MLFITTLSGDGKEVRREVTAARVRPTSEVFGELLCHYELPLFNNEYVENFNIEVIEEMVLAGIPQENKTYSFEYDLEGNKKMKFNLWRIDTNVFAEVLIRNKPDGEFTHFRNLVWYGVDSVDCFRVLPEGCVHEENVQDTYVDIC